MYAEIKKIVLKTIYTEHNLTNDIHPSKINKNNTCKLLCCSDKRYYYPVRFFRTSEKKFAASSSGMYCIHVHGHTRVRDRCEVTRVQAPLMQHFAVFCVSTFQVFDHSETECLELFPIGSVQLVLTELCPLVAGQLHGS